LGRDSLRHESLARSTNQGIKPCCAVFFSREAKAIPLGFMRLPAIPTLVSPKGEGWVRAAQEARFYAGSQILSNFQYETSAKNSCKPT
jgi:hypothetical protein